MGNHKQQKLDAIKQVSEDVADLATNMHRLNGVDLVKAVSMVHSSYWYLEIEEDFEEPWVVIVNPEDVYKAICYLNALVPSNSFEYSNDNPALIYTLEVFEKVRIELECRGPVLDIYFNEKNLYNLLMNFYAESNSTGLNYEEKAYEILGTIRDSNVVSNIPSASKSDYVVFWRPVDFKQIKGMIEFTISVKEPSQDKGKIVFDINGRTVRWKGEALESDSSREVVNTVIRNLCARISATRDIPYEGLVPMPTYGVEHLFDNETKELSQEIVDEIIRKLRHEIKEYRPLKISYSGFVPRWKRFSNYYAHIFTVEIPEEVLETPFPELDGEEGSACSDYSISIEIDAKVKELLDEVLGSGTEFVYTEVVFV